MRRYLRFPDLKAAGIVNNRSTLSRWMRLFGFPRPIHAGPNSLIWDEAEVLGWLDQRAAERDAEGSKESERARITRRRA